MQEPISIKIFFTDFASSDIQYKATSEFQNEEALLKFRKCLKMH